MKLPFYIFNVFAESNWGGNPLAIVPLLDASQSIDTHTMQRIARQFNLSETVFITPLANGQHAAHLSWSSFKPKRLTASIICI